jgi:hypothetical protein
MVRRYRRRNSFRVSLVALFVFACAPNRGHAQAPGISPPSGPRCEGNLSVHLSAPQAVFESGHPVPLRVEIQNCGKKELWIALSYEEFLGFPANLPLMIRDTHRRQVLPSTFWIHESPFGPGPHEWWIRLPPGYLYGRDVTLTKYESAFVETPGKYQITVSYSGIDRPSPLGKSPARPTSVPPEGSNVFTGRVESDPIVIEIVAPGSGNH